MSAAPIDLTAFSRERARQLAFDDPRDARGLPIRNGHVVVNGWFRPPLLQKKDHSAPGFGGDWRAKLCDCDNCVNARSLKKRPRPKGAA
jgi:hypothetical protein